MTVQQTSAASGSATGPDAVQRHRRLDQAEEVCPTTTRRRIAEGAVLVDVREPDEIALMAFDVPNLLAIPLSQLESRFDELPRDRDIVVVCQGGGRSLKATYFLMYQGFERVANMQGGILKWAAKGFPVMGNASAMPTTGQSPGSCCGGEAASPSASGCCGGGATTNEGGCC